ncbi:MAG: ROK family protein [Polyangia bacterium]|jgi:polyphosphate glucokinase
MTMLSDAAVALRDVAEAGSDAPVSESAVHQEQPAEDVSHAPFTLLIDVGARSIRSLLIDGNGTPSGKRQRQEIERPIQPSSVLAAIKKLIPDTTFTQISVCVPGAVKQGVIQASSGLGCSMIDFDLQRELAQAFERPVRVRSKAEWLGLGVVRGEGTELVLTLGKTLGVAVFFDGKLIPNVDLSQQLLRKSKTYQQCICSAARKKLGARKWSRMVRRAMAQLQSLFSPQRIYLYGCEVSALKGKLPDGVEHIEDKQALRTVVSDWDRNPS